MSDSENSDYLVVLEEAFGNLLAGESELAIECCEKARKIDPKRHEVMFVLGLISISMNDLGRAIKFMEEGHKTAPDCKEYADALAFLFSKVDRLSDSVYFSKLSLVLESEPILSKFTPENFGSFEKNMRQVDVSHSFVEASIAFHERRYDEAAKLCERELVINPDNTECQRMLGQSLIHIHEYGKAANAFATAARLEPHNSDNFSGMAEALLAQGDIDAAVNILREAIKHNPDSVDIRNRLVSELAYCPDDKWQTYIAEISQISELLAGTSKSSGASKFAGPFPGKIKVAYLVNEWAISNNADFLEGVLRHHNAAGITSYVYQQYSQPFTDTEKLKGEAENWREVYNIDDETLAFFIRNDAIHVIVDMCGSTPGNREKVLASKPAPVRASWLGFPVGAIAATTDVLLTCDELIEADEKYSPDVECLSLGAGLFCYGTGSVALETDDKNKLPADKNGFVTFGGILDMPRVVSSAEIWADVLNKVSNSRLIIGGGGETNQTTRGIISDMFTKLGVGDRVQVQENVEDKNYRRHLFSSIDILLDTAFVNGIHETCDALWMGIPVISLRGERRTALMGASILTSLGRKEWIARDRAEYLSIAAELASNVAALGNIRETLRETMKESTLCNQAGFTASMENTYKNALEKAIGNGN